MGFNKKYVSKEKLIEIFKIKGFDGIKEYINSSDILIGVNDDVDEILNIVFCDHCPTMKTLKMKNILYGE